MKPGEAYLLHDAKRGFCKDCKGYDGVMHDGDCWEKCDEFQAYLTDLKIKAAELTEQCPICGDPIIGRKHDCK